MKITFGKGFFETIEASRPANSSSGASFTSGWTSSLTLTVGRGTDDAPVAVIKTTFELEGPNLFPDSAFKVRTVHITVFTTETVLTEEQVKDPLIVGPMVARATTLAHSKTQQLLADMALSGDLPLTTPDLNFEPTTVGGAAKS